MTSLLQIIGAVLVLAGFGAAQFGRLATTSVIYLTVNLVGSGLLAGLALDGREWGFLLLEGVWAIVSAIGLIRLRHAAPYSAEASPH